MTPRLLRRAQVLELLQVAGTARWDRLAIERALDRAAGTEEPSAPTLAERAARWERSRCA